MLTTLTLRKLILFIDRSNLTDPGNHHPVINFNNRKIVGHIDCYTFENGFSMLAVDIKTLISCLVKNDTIKEGGNKNFFFVYFNERANLLIKLSDGKEDLISEPSLLMTGDGNEEIFLNRGTAIKAFVFVISKNWLQQQGMQLKSSLVAPLSKAENLFLKNITYYSTLEGNLLRLRITVFNLFLYSLERQINEAEIVPPGDRNHSEVLQAVEQKILDHLYTSAPSIEEMAKEFYMSPSTLKRKFKRVFGSNIYEYYLKHKMQLAKDILEHKHLKVSEVAAQLHYENVSQFIRIFKKINGFLPGRYQNKKSF